MKITITVDKIFIRKQHDRLFGKGIDIYPAYLATNAEGGKSGTASKKDNLKNGENEIKVDVLSINLEPDRAATFNLFMMESDGSDEKLKAALSKMQSESSKIQVSGTFDEFMDTIFAIGGVAAAVVGGAALAGGAAIPFAWSVNGAVVSGGVVAAGSPLAVLIPGGILIAGIFMFAKFAPGKDDDSMGIYSGLVATNADGSQAKIGIARADEQSSVESTSPVIVTRGGPSVALPKATFKNDKQDLDYFLSAKFE